MQNKSSPAAPAESFTAEDFHLLRHIVQTVRIRVSIPRAEHADLRSMLHERLLGHQAELVSHREDFIPLALRIVRCDIADYARSRLAHKERIISEATSIDGADPDGAPALNIPDPHDAIEDSLLRLDRVADRLARRNWHRRFRRRVAKLKPKMRRFLYALADTRTRADLCAATGLSRKGCYLRHQRLKEIFEDLRQSHRNLV